MNRFSRRVFLKSSTAAGAGAMAGRALKLGALLAAAKAPAFAATETAKPALLGGTPVRKAAFPKWPIIDETEERIMADILKSGKWFRGYGTRVIDFEAAYAKLTGAQCCVATANGTSSLIAALGALEIGPGDEVILPPYTFVATLNAITFQYALPIFVDSDPETFQIDAKKIEGAITERTAALMPVHLGGCPADLDAIMAIAGKRKLPVIEDACQAHLAEWRGKKVGSIGTAGCFSFQASKNLNSGEGGAVLTNDPELAEKIYAFHNNLRARQVAGYNFTYRGTRGTNVRMTEFQAGLLMAQMARVAAQAQTRTENAKFLSAELAKIPGCLPGKMYEGTTRNAYHLYMFRYDAEAFGGLPRAKFIKALSAEGIPASSGYSPLNKEEFIKTLLQSKAYRKIYPAAVLDTWAERTACPANDKLCEQAVWFIQTMLLGSHKDMEDIIAAVKKIQANAAALAKA